jgi:aspartate/methionine/tyrosine aminotransferase
LVASPGEANFVLMNVLLEQGDEVICMAPMYQSLYEVAQSIGCKIVFWEPDNQVDWYYNPMQLEALVTPKTKLIIVNFPHNPTGYLPSLEDWERIIAIARNRDIFLFSDEMYRGLVHDVRDEIPAACDRYHNAISLWGMAKSFGMAGLRIGWLASKNKAVLQKVEAFKDYLSICNSATSEYLATIALKNSDHFLQVNLAKIRRNKAIFQAFAQQNNALVEFTPPRAGSTTFVQLKIAGSTMDYAENLVHETGIMLLPSETYNYGSGFCRVGFGRENMPQVLEIWQQWIDRRGE